MKTRDQFVLLADAYRKEVRWRSWGIFAAIIPVFIACLSIAGFLGRIIGHESEAAWAGLTLFLIALLALSLYQTKSQENLARKLELFCSSCTHAFSLADFKLAIATHNCPYCGEVVFS